MTKILGTPTELDWKYIKINISSINLDLCWQEDDRVGDAEWRWGYWDVLELVDCDCADYVFGENDEAE